jgi:hypothetical protein
LSVEADQHVGTNACGLAAQLAFQADEAAQKSRKHQPQQDMGIQIVEHCTFARGDSSVMCARS